MKNLINGKFYTRDECNKKETEKTGEAFMYV